MQDANWQRPFPTRPQRVIDVIVVLPMKKNAQEAKGCEVCKRGMEGGGIQFFNPRPDLFLPR
jgi:hypothetical protein